MLLISLLAILFSFLFYSYRGVTHAGNPKFKLDISQLSPLLEEDTLSTLINVFIEEKKQHFIECMQNIIKMEVKV